MKKLFNLSLCFVLGLMSFSFLALPSYAQEDLDDEYLDTTYEEQDYDYDYGYDYDYDYYGTEELGGGIPGLLGGMGALFAGGAFIFTLILSAGLYIYSALALMTIAKKLGQKNEWFAWIPILNIILLFQMGEKNPWLILIALIPGIGGFIVGIISIICIMTICEKRGYDKLLGLLTLIPLANLILLGVLAWGKKE